MVKKKKPRSYRTRFKELYWYYEDLLDDYDNLKKRSEGYKQGFDTLHRHYTELVTKYNNLIDPQKETEKII